MPVASYAHVLVPLDGPSFADRALPVAQELAARFGARVAVVAVGEDAQEVEWLRNHAVDVARMVAGPGEAVHALVGPDPVAEIEGMPRAG